MHSTSGSILIPASLAIDPVALAALTGTATPPEIFATLARVERLLVDCRERLELGSKLLLSAKQVATMTDQCERSVTGAAARGELAFIKMGKRVVFKREDVIEYIERNRTPAKPPSMRAAG